MHHLASALIGGKHRGYHHEKANMVVLRLYFLITSKLNGCLTHSCEEDIVSGFTK